MKDFNVAEDKINIDDILDNRLSGWDGSSNPFASGDMKLNQDGADPLFQLDSNGLGNSYVIVVRMVNTTATSFSEANFQVNPTFEQGYNSDGSGVIGSPFNGSAAAKAITGTHGDDLINRFAGMTRFWAAMALTMTALMVAPITTLLLMAMMVTCYLVVVVAVMICLCLKLATVLMSSMIFRPGQAPMM